MALLDDILKGDAGKGLAIGLGAALLAPVALAAMAGIARPLARAAIKSGIIVYEKGRETLAEFGEVMEDLAAEARAELEQSHGAAAVAVGAQEAGTEAKAESGEHKDSG